VKILRLSVPVFLLGAVLVIVGAWSAQGRADVLVETDSLYHHIIVEADGSIRRLLFRRRGVEHSESAIDLDAPLKPQMRYVELMFSGMFYCPEPRDILMIGLGGGIVSRMLAHYLPDANVVTVELDEKVFELAKEHFGFKPTERNKVVIRDGRVHVKRTLSKDAPRFDMILLDAYRGGFVPYHLTTREFMDECRRLLKPGGVLVSNLRTDFRTYDYQRRTMDKVFPMTVAFGADVGNTVVCALPTKVDVSQTDLRRRAEALQARHRFEFDLLGVARARQATPDYEKRGEIFTDDYAPANILRRR
jgi:spermidine synthase